MDGGPLFSGWSIFSWTIFDSFVYFNNHIVFSAVAKHEDSYKSSIADLENKQYEVLKNFKTLKILQLESLTFT